MADIYSLDKNGGDNYDGSGFNEEDIQALMKSSKVSKKIAIKALPDANGNLVTASMKLAL